MAQKSAKKARKERSLNRKGEERGVKGSGRRRNRSDCGHSLETDMKKEASQKKN